MRLDDQRWPAPVAIAHRGSRMLWPENTMLAFSSAVDLGYRHLETDLHMTADGVLVCFHDDTLDRTTDGTGRVEDLTLKQIRSLDAGYRHRTNGRYVFRGQGVRVPTLEELLTSFPDVSVVVDLKTDGLEEPLARLVSALGLHDRLMVGAFSDKRLAIFRDLTEGRVATSVGPMAARAWVLTSRMRRGIAGQASALQLPTHMRGVRVVDERLVDAAHAAGLQVHVWTVNSESAMERLLDIGVDGLISDRPDLLRDVLERRGQWPG